MQPAVSPTDGSPSPQRRPFSKRLMMWLRRSHLYLGLFLFPWAILYGVTAFLFNHPTVLSDQPTRSFGRSELAGTPLETLPVPGDLAEVVISKVNASQKPAIPYKLAGEAKLGTRDFAFATVKAEGQTINVLIDLKSGTGTVRSTPEREQKVNPVAPFAIGTNSSDRPTANRPRTETKAAGAESRLEIGLAEQIRSSIPTILERTGFATGEVTVTSVPDLIFPIDVDGQTWMATFNPMTGSLSGVPAGSKTPAELSWRRFALRLHTAHGYPGQANERWAWAVVVDAMAITMCFWGMSGLLMWWQIKATRMVGAFVLLVSASLATILGVAMHSMMTAS